VIFKEATGEESEAQLQAFSDSWHWTNKTQQALEEMAETAPSKLVDLINGFTSVLGHNDVTAYLVMMAIRLVELHRALKPTGSLYLHCDPTVSPYLRMVLDTILGQRNFRNEIVWKRSDAHNDAKQGAKHYGRIHDVLLFYTKGNSWTWNSIYTPLPDSTKELWYRHIEESTGRHYNKADLTAAKPGGDTLYEWKGVRPPSGRYWAYSREKMEQMEKKGLLVYSASGRPYMKRYLDESKGVSLQDWWSDIDMLRGINSAERLGFPTQKPIALLERIIQASSNEGDLVLDPFCGCGTTIIAAQKLKRRWIGIDITHLAISLMKYRLHDTFGTEAKYRVEGEPADTASAYSLAEKDRYQFQWWALSLIKARPVGDEKKKGADKGIDGTLFFIDDAKAPSKKVIIQVKSGKVQAKDIRELTQVVHREKAVMGFFITLEEPSKNMLEEAITEGFYKSSGWQKQYAKIQIRTIEQLLHGEDFDMPPTNVSFKRAEKARQRVSEQGLFQSPKVQEDSEDETEE
jgi:DNA modification methylase